ncbi:L-seryl-tRNA(Sec) selenium transferase [Pelotomaculum terephthalicicum JT]|uniref:L-seryl-tRNA(Sec) selenium transferase n=1 Tax=Pelotomaculum terephthalicicum TaxID=206393 RepID=UPI0009CBC73B|nr:L-seryl-tRNA(Sec) selenium transferase [Pelotomaculum terephthalicicum]MCG9966458.1 L-seryl-tRNA(Sec) selenium transferase [Pelotomaculum terephthalicicum JT]OPY63401.1 MAG: L-seryl-tRNA(Sec) selenium transferase [Pelotomaculum sp. PtaU1.Bin065]
MSKKSWEQGVRLLPSVDETLRDDRVAELLAVYPRSMVVEAVRDSLAGERRRLLDGDPAEEDMDENSCLDLIVLRTTEAVRKRACSNLQPVINATGVVLHTNLGRALLSENARRAVYEIASSYSNLELELTTGRRGSRYAPLEPVLTSLTGAEAALVVNNNAAAVLLALSTLAKEREVVVSRGQLVEIGGSFRIPEVMAQSGARLVEVGATNKTYPDDYRKAINEQTALLLHVHTSNYRIIGFTRETTINELVEIGRAYSLPVMSDLGSGSLLDLSRFGLPGEPTVREVVAAGPDVITFSGDKLLGGPQAGVIAGKRRYIDKMRKHPLLRAIRVDKMTVAALEATLREYLDEELIVEKMPTLQMLAAGSSQLTEKAESLAGLVRGAVENKAEVEVGKGFSVVGGGSFPSAELPTAIVKINSRATSAGDLQSALMRGKPAVMSRVQDGSLILDVRTVRDHELPALAAAIGKVI